MPRASYLATSLILLLLFSGSIRADDWPQWRGLNRDGTWNETGILESFPSSGLKVRWRAPVGFGYSSPVVAQGRVYLTDAELMKPKAIERLHCLNEVTGKPLWTFAYDVAYPDWAFTPANEGRPIPTPIVHAGKVYTLGMLGHLFCLDAGKGDVLWKKNLDTEYQVQEFSCKSSPMIEGDLLILVVGGKPNACVLALDKNSGKEAWRALDEAMTNSSPIVISTGGKQQLIVWTQESVTSLDPASGKRYWRERTSSEYAAATPVLHKNLLLMSGLMLKLGPEKPAVLWPESKASSV